MDSLVDQTNFWNKLEAEYGVINSHLKNIICVQNLCSQSLGRLNIETIKQIERDMRDMAPDLQDEALNGGKPVSEIYGVRYAKKPELFRFIQGEILCLLDLAEIIRSRGIRTFIRQNRKLVKKVKVSHKIAESAPHQIDPTDFENADEEAVMHGKMLQEKILLYFASLNVRVANYDHVLTTLQKLRVNAEHIEDRWIASVMCPLCEEGGKVSEISLSMDRAGNWHTYSFKRHCYTIHFKLPMSACQASDSLKRSNATACSSESSAQLGHPSRKQMCQVLRENDTETESQSRNRPEIEDPDDTMPEADPLKSGSDPVTNIINGNEKENIIDGSLADATASCKMIDQTDNRSQIGQRKQTYQVLRRIENNTESDRQINYTVLRNRTGIEDHDVAMPEADLLQSGSDPVTGNEKENIIDGSLADVTASYKIIDHRSQIRQYETDQINSTVLRNRTGIEDHDAAMPEEDPLQFGSDPVTNTNEKEDIIDGSLADVTASYKMNDQTGTIPNVDLSFDDVIDDPVKYQPGVTSADAIPHKIEVLNVESIVGTAFREVPRRGEVEVQFVNQCELPRAVREIDLPGTMSIAIHKFDIEQIAVTSVVPEREVEAKFQKECDLVVAIGQVDVGRISDGEIDSGLENEEDQTQSEKGQITADTAIQQKEDAEDLMCNAVPTDYELNDFNPEIDEATEKGLGQLTSCNSSFRCNFEYLEENEEPSPDSPSPRPSGPSNDPGAASVRNDLPTLLYLIEKLPVTQMVKQLVKETVTNNIKHMIKDHRAVKGSRYMEDTKNIGAYLYLLGGRKDYEELVVNLGLPSVCTIMRHIRKSCDKITEGKLRVQELLNFLEKRNLPKIVFISEDGTKITSRTRYDIEKDQLVGLCPKLNQNGMPEIGSFSAGSPNMIQEHLKNNEKSSIVYVILATPIAQKTLSFNLLSFGTNNKFSIEEVLLRWAIMEHELLKAGITIVGYGADGDTRLIGSMKIRMGLPRSIDILPCDVPSLWKSWYAAQGRVSDIYIQDPTHIINKMKNCLLSSTRTLQIGKFPASRGHLIALAKEGKENTGLSESDLEQHDKMCVKSFYKIIDPRVNEWLHKYPGTNSTIAFITVMKLVFDSYEHPSLSPLERIRTIWCATFFVRVWHRWVQQSDHLRLDEHFLTNNVELGIELNAHSIINYLMFCRNLNRPELFLPTLLNSQHNERSFANARSMTGAQNTVINFDMLEYLNKATRFEYLDELRRKLDGKISFSRDSYKAVEFEKFEFPTNCAINEAVCAGKFEAQHLLDTVGLEWEDIDFECALSSSTRNTVFPLAEVDILGEESEESPPGISDEDIIFEARALLSSLGSDICKVSKTVNDESEVKAPKGFFKIATATGKIMLARKVTILWLLSSNTTKISNDRLLRFQPCNSAAEIVLKNDNKIEDNLSIGEWFIYQEGNFKIVAQALGFMFLQGKLKRDKECTLKTVPIKPPNELKNPRGIGIICSKFTITAGGNLCIVSNSAKININRYVSHIEKPFLDQLTPNCNLYVTNLLT